MTLKDFAPIESDYAFFMAHATEAEFDAAGYLRELAGFADGRGSIRMLDFGCGTGEFTERLVTALNWPPQALHLTLIEPVAHQRAAAAGRLARSSRYAIETGERLPAADEPRFDLILSNHALYYVDDLAATLQQMTGLLRPGGRLLLAIAGWDNALLAIWKAGFGLAGRPVPWYAAEDVETLLVQHGGRLRKSEVRYCLRFPDNVANRLRILRFLFGDHLPALPRESLLSEFDCYARGDQIEVHTNCWHFALDRG